MLVKQACSDRAHEQDAVESEEKDLAMVPKDTVIAALGGILKQMHMVDARMNVDGMQRDELFNKAFQCTVIVVESEVTNL